MLFKWLINAEFWVLNRTRSAVRSVHRLNHTGCTKEAETEMLHIGSLLTLHHRYLDAEIERRAAGSAFYCRRVHYLFLHEVRPCDNAANVSYLQTHILQLKSAADLNAAHLLEKPRFNTERVNSSSVCSSAFNLPPVCGVPCTASWACASMVLLALSAMQVYTPASSSVRLEIWRLPPPRSSTRPSLEIETEKDLMCDLGKFSAMFSDNTQTQRDSFLHQVDKGCSFWDWPQVDPTSLSCLTCCVTFCQLAAWIKYGKS